MCKVRDTEKIQRAYENQSDVEVLIALLDEVDIICHCLLLIDLVEFETGVVALDGL